jgi:hypothetical protein
MSTKCGRSSCCTRSRSASALLILSSSRVPLGTRVAVSLSRLESDSLMLRVCRVCGLESSNPFLVSLYTQSAPLFVVAISTNAGVLHRALERRDRVRVHGAEWQPQRGRRHQRELCSAVLLSPCLRLLRYPPSVVCKELWICCVLSAIHGNRFDATLSDRWAAPRSMLITRLVFRRPSSVPGAHDAESGVLHAHPADFAVVQRQADLRQPPAGASLLSFHGILGLRSGALCGTKLCSGRS